MDKGIRSDGSADRQGAKQIERDPDVSPEIRNSNEKQGCFSHAEEENMNKGSVIVYYGDGKGKSSSAIGHAICAAGAGESVAIIQFLKGNNQKEIDFLKRLEPDVRLFSFEKNAEFFEELSEEQKQEEISNIRNGLNFAKKVLVTGECTILVLDEVLGLLEKNIITVDDIRTLIEAKDEETELILTGIYMREELMQYTDAVYEIKSIKEDE